MKRLAISALLIASISPALAQEKIVTFTLTVTEAQTVMNAVTEHPWKDVNPVMQKMIAQANAQLATPPAPPPPAAPQPPPSTSAPAAPPEK